MERLRQLNEGITAMTRLAEDYDYVIGGDPDRDTIDLAVLDTATGSVRAHVEATADGPGYTHARMGTEACPWPPGLGVGRNG